MAGHEKEIGIENIWDYVAPVQPQAAEVQRPPTPAPEQPSDRIRARLEQSRGVQPMADVQPVVPRSIPQPQARQLPARRPTRAITGEQYAESPPAPQAAQVVDRATLRAEIERDMKLDRLLAGKRSHKGLWTAGVMVVVLAGAGVYFAKVKGHWATASVAEKSRSSSNKPSPTASKKPAIVPPVIPATPTPSGSATPALYKSVPLGCVDISVNMENVTVPVDILWTPGETAPSPTNTSLSPSTKSSTTPAAKPTKTPPKSTSTPPPTSTSSPAPKSYNVTNAFSEVANGTEILELCDASGEAGVVDKTQTIGAFSQTIVLNGDKLTLSVKSDTGVVTQLKGTLDSKAEAAIVKRLNGAVTEAQVANVNTGINATAIKLKNQFRMQLLGAIGGFIETGTDSKQGTQNIDGFTAAGENVLLAQLTKDALGQNLPAKYLNGGKPSMAGSFPSVSSVTLKRYALPKKSADATFHSELIQGSLTYTAAQASS